MPFLAMRRRVRGFAEAVLVLSIGVSMMSPAFARFASLFSGEPMVIGFLVALNALVSFLADAPMGDFVDRFSKKTTMLWGVTLMALALLMFYMSTSVWLFALASVVMGVAGTAIWVPGRAIVYGISTKKTHGKDMGTYASSYDIGWTLGPLIGGFVANEFGLTTPFLAGSVVALIALALLAWRIPKSEARGERLADAVKDTIQKDGVIMGQLRFLRDANTPMLLSIVSYIVLYIVWTSLIMVIPLVFTALNEAEIGIVFLFLTLPFGLFAIPIGDVVDRLGKRAFMFFGAAAAAPLLFGYLFFSDIIMLSVVSFLFATALVMLNTALNAISADAAPPKHRGAVSGIMVLSGDLGWLIGPLTAGLLMQYVGPFAPFVFGAALLLVVGIANAVLIRN